MYDHTGKKTDETFLDVVVERVGEHLGDTPFVWMGNTDVGDDIFKDKPHAVRLPNSPHGLNEFQSYDAVVVISALNPTPAHFRFLQEIAHVNPDKIKAAGYRQAVYQAAGRISIRDKKSTTRKQVVVMDLATADWLEDIFPGATINSLIGLDTSNFQRKTADQSNMSPTQ